MRLVLEMFSLYSLCFVYVGVLPAPSLCVVCILQCKASCFTTMSREMQSYLPSTFVQVVLENVTFFVEIRVV